MHVYAWKDEVDQLIKTYPMETRQIMKQVVLPLILPG